MPKQLPPKTPKLVPPTKSPEHERCFGFEVCYTPRPEVIEFFEGADQCEKIKDGQTSLACYFAALLLFVGLVLSIVVALACIANLYNKPRTKEAVLLFGSLCLVYITSLGTRLMYTHCSRCNGLVGLGKVLLLFLGFAAIVGLVFFGSYLMSSLITN
jgi:hypothetical protein